MRTTAVKGLSANFDFLGKHDAQLVRLGGLAERYFKDDPSTSLIKLHQFGELLAQLTAAKSGLLISPDEPQVDLLRRLKFERIVPQSVGDLFHQLRIAGNRATHQNIGDHVEALTGLKLARELGIWFHRTFADAKFSAGPFVPPPDPAKATQALHEELVRLRNALDETRSQAEKDRETAQAEARARISAEERATKESEDRALWEQLAHEAETAKAALAAQLQALQNTAAQAPAQTTAAIVAQAEAAAAEIDIDEAQRHGWLKNGNPPGNFSTSPRCGAKTRRQTACCRPAMKNGRCRMHGGLSTGPRTPEGLARSQRANWKHGAYSREIRELLAENRRRWRALKAFLNDI